MFTKWAIKTINNVHTDNISPETLQNLKSIKINIKHQGLINTLFLYRPVFSISSFDG